MPFYFNFIKIPLLFYVFLLKSIVSVYLYKVCFLDLAVAKSLQSTRMVTDADDNGADADDDVLTTTGYTC